MVTFSRNEFWGYAAFFFFWFFGSNLNERVFVDVDVFLLQMSIEFLHFSLFPPFWLWVVIATQRQGNVFFRPADPAPYAVSLPRNNRNNCPPNRLSPPTATLPVNTDPWNRPPKATKSSQNTKVYPSTPPVSAHSKETTLLLSLRRTPRPYTKRPPSKRTKTIWPTPRILPRREGWPAKGGGVHLSPPLFP